MARPDRRKTRRSCCFSRSQGDRNRLEVAFPVIKALDRNTRRTVAWVVAGDDAATVRRLYCQLEHWNDCLFQTDDWHAWAKVWPPERQVRGKKYTLAIEPDNSNPRYRLGRMSRRRKIVSQSEEMISISMRLWHALTMAEIFTESQRKLISIYISYLLAVSPADQAYLSHPHYFAPLMIGSHSLDFVLTYRNIVFGDTCSTQNREIYRTRTS